LADARGEKKPSSSPADAASDLLDASSSDIHFSHSDDLDLTQPYHDDSNIWEAVLGFDLASAAQAPSSVSHPWGEDAASYFSAGPLHTTQSLPGLTSSASEYQAPPVLDAVPSSSFLHNSTLHRDDDHVTLATEKFLMESLSKSAIDYLVGLFFTRGMMMLKFISPRQFLSEGGVDSILLNRRPPSSLLLAIIAAALRYATRADVLDVCFDGDGNNVPAALAKKLLERELLHAKMSTVQALLILCEVETSSNNMMSGYMYVSMAAKLLFDLRLDYGSGVDPSVPKDEALAQYWLLWNLSVSDFYCKHL
jgi:hypothetical protein